MEGIYFDDTTTDVVNDWIKEIKEDNKSTTSTSYDLNDARKSQGLGYNSGQGKKGQGLGIGGIGTSDALVDRLNKKRKKELLKEQTIEITHGIVEEEILSRVSTNKKRKIPNEFQSKKQNPSIVSTPTETISSNSTISTSNQSPVVINSESTDGNDGQKRKRVKTRSKQKNIRRDKRAPEFKPSHLQIGSKEYQGRPLTQVRKFLFL